MEREREKSKQKAMSKTPRSLLLESWISRYFPRGHKLEPTWKAHSSYVNIFKTCNINISIHPNAHWQSKRTHILRNLRDIWTLELNLYFPMIPICSVGSFHRSFHHLPSFIFRGRRGRVPGESTELSHRWELPFGAINSPFGLGIRGSWSWPGGNYRRVTSITNHYFQPLLSIINKRDSSSITTILTYINDYWSPLVTTINHEPLWINH